MTTKIKPFGNRIVVKRHKQAEKSKGGILIPETKVNPELKADVVAIGPGEIHEGEIVSKHVPVTCVKVGDVVLIGKWAGQEFEDNDEKYLILPVTDLYGVYR
jgi:chaperonin GroES